MNCCDFPAQIASSGVNIPGLPPTVRLADLYVSYTLLTFSTRCCHGEPTSLTAWRCLGEGKKKKKEPHLQIFLTPINICVPTNTPY